MSPQRQSNPGTDIFYSWSTASIVGFWLITLLVLASVPLLNVPVGLAFFALIFFLPLVWKDPNEQHVLNGGMIMDTMPYKVASFMYTMKGPSRKHIFEIDDLFGFGPPEDDTFMDLEESFFHPPGRVAAYWSLGFALNAAALEFLIHPYIFPVWGDIQLPSIVSYIISAIFFFASFQALNTTRRYQLAMNLTGVERVPAVMINKIPKDGTMKQANIKQGVVNAVILGVGIVICFILSTVIDDFPWLWAILFNICLSVSVGIFYFFNVISESYRKEFYFQVERRDFWNSVFGYKNMLMPFFEMQTAVPGEPGKPGGPPEGEEPGEPHVWVSTFAYPVNGTFADYANDAPKILPSIPEAEMLAISPIPKKNEAGEAIPGTVSSTGFRVWWSDIYIGMNELLQDPDITPEQKEIAIRFNVLDPLAEIKAINRCLIHSHSMMTAPDSKVHIMKVSLVPPSGVTEAVFIRNLDKIQSSLGVKWVRAKKNVDNHGRSIIELFIGDGTPQGEGIEFPRGIAASRYRQVLNAVHWEYVHAINGIMSPQGSPTLMMSREVTNKSTELIFDLPPGVSYGMIKKKADDLMTTSGNMYMETQEGIPNKKKFTRKENREIERYMKNNGSVSQFTAVVSTTHPLEDIFLFSEYKDKLITGRERGVAKISWSPGVKSDGSLAIHDFGDDMPHLVIAGSSGSGKSVLIYSMYLQLSANNHPEDLEFWLIDPKIGLQQLGRSENTGQGRFVDSWSHGDGNFYIACRDMLKDAVDEMARRNGIFNKKMQELEDNAADGELVPVIDKLAVARSIGIKEGPLPDGSPNPLVQPYIVIIIDECALLFTPSTNKEVKDLQAEILFHASRLARESRSAGIHCVFATQYPTTVSLPSLIKQQSARIGLMTQDNIASRVIIDQDGLEELFLKGSGKIQEGKNYRDFRGFLLEDDKLNEHSMSELLASFPKRKTPQGATAGIPGQQSQDPDYITIPEPDSSIFSRWNTNSKQARALRSAVGENLDGSKSDQKPRGADKISTDFSKALDEFMNMSEEEWDNVTLEDFRRKVSSFGK